MIFKKIFFTVGISLLIFKSVSGQIADTSYLKPIKKELEKQWPNNRTLNLIFHGHSVPAGYFDTPNVHSLDAYPHLVMHALKEKYPYAAINVITTGIGGENSAQGMLRFDDEVLNHKPDVLFIDYSLNDRGIGLAAADSAWRKMIEKALAKGIKVVLLTPTLDKRADYTDESDELNKHRLQVISLAKEYGIGLIDSYSLFVQYIQSGGDIDDIMSWVNHPNRNGHELIVNEILKWF